MKAFSYRFLQNDVTIEMRLRRWLKAIMDTLETIEGTLKDRLWFHLDVGNDVLYIRLKSKRRTTTVGEETDDGVVLLRDEKSGKPVGATVINWWKRFGKGSLPDSLNEIQKKIEPWRKRIVASH